MQLKLEDLIKRTPATPHYIRGFVQGLRLLHTFGQIDDRVFFATLFEAGISIADVAACCSRDDVMAIRNWICK